jgi:hypothetical protein
MLAVQAKVPHHRSIATTIVTSLKFSNAYQSRGFNYWCVCVSLWKLHFGLIGVPPDAKTSLTAAAAAVWDWVELLVIQSYYRPLFTVNNSQTSCCWAAFLMTHILCLILSQFLKRYPTFVKLLLFTVSFCLLSANYLHCLLSQFCCSQQ